MFGVLAGFSAPAMAKSDGILVVGTQEEVQQILAGTSVHPQFSESRADAMVAVRLTNGTMTTYEGCEVDEIIKFVGKVAKGGVVFTLKVGCALCDLLKDLGGVTVHIGEAALKAACWVLTHAKCLVCSGVTLVVHTATEVLKAVADFIHCIIHCP